MAKLTEGTLLIDGLFVIDSLVDVAATIRYQTFAVSSSQLLHSAVAENCWEANCW